jgi:hypothetical protein
MITSHYEFEQGDLEDLKLFLSYHPNQYPIVFIIGGVIGNLDIEALSYPPLKKSWFENYFPPRLPHEFNTFPRITIDEVRTGVSHSGNPRRIATVGWKAAMKYTTKNMALRKNNIQVYRDTDEYSETYGETGLEIRFQTLILQGTVGNDLFNELRYMELQEYFENPANQEEFELWTEFDVSYLDNFIRLKYQPHIIQTLNYPRRS